MSGARQRVVFSARLEMAWLTDCLAMFKDNGVNIRSLVVRPEFRSAFDSQGCGLRHLELEFTLPGDNHASERFLAAFQHHLAQCPQS